MTPQSPCIPCDLPCSPMPRAHACCLHGCNAAGAHADGRPLTGHPPLAQVCFALVAGARALLKADSHELPALLTGLQELTDRGYDAVASLEVRAPPCWPWRPAEPS